MLPDIINYLLALKRPPPDGGYVCYRAASQIRIENFVPGATIGYTVLPLFNRYALIGWRAIYSPSIVPGSFSISYTQYGSRQLSGVMTDIFITEGLDYLLFITNDQPGIFSITNTTPLVQTFESLTNYLDVVLESDYKIILEALTRYGNRAASQCDTQPNPDYSNVK